MRQKSRYEEITAARELLGIDESATLGEIKARYKNMISKWHPDVCREKKETCEKMAQKVNAAYKCLISYCENYKYSFSRQEVEKYLSHAQWWFEHFGSDPLWGDGNPSDPPKD